MTEELDFVSPGSQDDEIVVAPPESAAAAAGAALRQVRESKGIHLVSLAATLKVPTKSLEYLEAGEFEKLPDLVFAKALAASMCRFMGVDAAEVMQSWPVTRNPTMAKLEPITPIKPAVFDPYPGRTTPLRWLLMLLSFAIIVGGLVWLWMKPSVELDSTAVSNADMVQTPQPHGNAATNVAEGSQEEKSSDAAPMAQAPDKTPLGKSKVEAAGSDLATSSSTGLQQFTDEQVTGQFLAKEPTRETGGGQIVAQGPNLALYFSQKSWVKIQNPTNGVLIERLAQAGDVVLWPLSDKPLSVVIGYAPAVRVKVAGQERDISGDTQREVARFTVE